ncbi:MAG: hypothetical protein JWP40_121 [Blastococcus sp.]|nr:hypothetical protein [Blastococcus sp.]
MTLDVYSGLFDDGWTPSPTASTKPQSALVRPFADGAGPDVDPIKPTGR